MIWLCVYLVIAIPANVFALLEWLFGGWTFDKVFNSVEIYENIPVNIFGCIVLTLLYHILFLPFAPFYWFYKLCTVGRR